jgi:methylmalonyl-CoA/ethylmalonyl-CoA epimerase
VKLTRIHHVALAVRDIESALGFYRDVLGLAVGRQAKVAEQGVHAALLPLQEGEIELLEPTDPTGGVARFLERRGEGLHHICFETPDVAATLVQAMAADLPLIDQTPRPGLAGLIGFLHPKASHGLLVEVAQLPAHPERCELQPAGVGVIGIDTVYVVTKEAGAAAATLARNFGGGRGPDQVDGHLEARQVAVWVGRSRITVVSPTDPSGSSGLARFLAERGEGLYGLGWRVREFPGALRHLASAGVSVDVMGAQTTTPLACLETGRAYGAHLFLRSATPVQSS